MKRRRRMILIIAAVTTIVLIVVVVSNLGTRRLKKQYNNERADLFKYPDAVEIDTTETKEIGQLPSPVRRYLEVTGVDGPSCFKNAVLKQRGELRVAPEKSWIPFEAEQVYSMNPPGFVWLAKATFAPFVHVLALDRFVDGKGKMKVNLLGLFDVVDASGVELDLGAGLRYWGEIIAFPETVLDPHLSWEPIDERHARLFVKQGELNMTASVEFDDDGFFVGLRAKRYRDVDGTPVLTDWSGRMKEWRELNGRLFPTSWESIWHPPGGSFTAVRMEVLELKTVQ